jgi:hypothetical protein
LKATQQQVKFVAISLRALGHELFNASDFERPKKAARSFIRDGSSQENSSSHPSLYGLRSSFAQHWDPSCSSQHHQLLPTIR